MRAVALVLVLAAGCGRIGFDDRIVPNRDGGVDATADALLPVGRWAKVALSDLSTCAITTTAELWCWGFGYYGQLGIGTLPDLAPPTKVGDGWRDVAVQSDHACGIKTDGSLWCWGEDNRGQLGDNRAAQLQVAPKLVMAGPWTALALSYESTCALAADQTLWCWGKNDLGELGIGNATEADVPQQLADHWTAIAAGQGHVCAIRAADSTLWCWGVNGSRQLGTGDTLGHTVPTPVSGGMVFARVAAGSTFTCATEPSGTTSCWGDGEVGQLGIVTTNGAATPVAQQGPAFATIALGTRNGCGIATTGLWCWGSGQRGALAELAQLEVTAPTHVAAANPTQIATGGATTCYIDDQARLFCTGANGGGQTGQPFGEVHTVAQADARTDWKAIYAHANHACGIYGGGTASCWGTGEDGQLGDGGYFDRQTPVDVALTGVTMIEMSDVTTAAIAGGVAYDWGFDLGSGQDLATPNAYGAEQWVTVSHDFGCAIGSGTLVCAGKNTHGQLGDGTFNDSPTTTVAGAWTSVRAASQFTCGKQTNGQMSCWGGEPHGEGGNGMTGDSPLPLPVSLSMAVDGFALGDAFACALTGGKLSCWGANDRGQVGDGTGTQRLTPAQVGSSVWLAIAAGDLHACGIQIDHSLWCWGHSDEGQLGDGGLIDVLAPQRVGTDTDWTQVATGDHFTCALKAGGTRWCFGANDHGELGNGRAWLTGFAAVP